MDKLKNRRAFVRKVGQQVPEAVTRLMAIRHPTVDIMWEAKSRRWCLVQTVRGVSMLIRVLKGPRGYEPPTLLNTVYFLDACHPSRLRSKFAREKFLASLDESREAQDIEKRSKDQIHEGSKDLWNAFKNRIVVDMGSKK